jgi:hypothetical protein
VGETIAGVANHDVDGLAALLFADEGYVIDGFEDLATPLVVYSSKLYKVGSWPTLWLPRRA